MLTTQDKPEVLQEIYSSYSEGERLKQCIQCGTCSATCPYEEGMDRPVRWLIAALRANMLEEVLKSRTLWMCVSCHACKVHCPKKIDIPDILMAYLREKLVLEGRVAHTELQEALENTAKYGNPQGLPSKKRTAWTKDLGFQVPVFSPQITQAQILWFVECYPSYYERNIEVTKKFAEILNLLEINYAILGNDEKCAGDCQRLAGEKGLFQELAQGNIKAMDNYKFSKILVTDPHAYNAFLNEYSQFGGKYDVTHYTQFLVDYIDKLKPLFKKTLNYTVTFHDPCYLGRKNNEYDAPRKILQIIPGIKFVEMPYSKQLSLCCGGGGGGMWLDSFIAEYVKERVSDRRVKQAVATGADVLAVCCPYELPRFEDAVKVTDNEEKIKVMDIIELIYEAIF